ncbi:MAG: hypothetical protein GC190_21400 [Alphaproteobacteria bacterium]|nr:hypothetical protein [Alphaproteobacteria bacterium]
MSGDRPRLIWLPTSFSQGVARTDAKTWGVLTILLVIAIAVVVVLNVFHEKKPMFGNAPFGQAPAQQRERVVPVARPGDVPPARPH